MSLSRLLETLESFLVKEASRAIHEVRFFLMGQELRAIAPTPEPLKILLDRYAPYRLHQSSLPFGPQEAFKAVFTGPFPEELSHIPLKPLSPKEASSRVGPYRLLKKLRSGLRTLIQLEERTLWIEEPSLVDWNSMMNILNDFLSLEWLNSGFVLMHAGAVATERGDVVLLASSSGRGKTTAIFRLLGDGFRYVANDRVLVGPAGSSFGAVGFPKLPRVNPGTMVADPILRNLLDSKEKEGLTSIDPERLWMLESKRDISLEDVYGEGVIGSWGWLKMIVFLEWSRGMAGPLRVVRVRSDRLGVVFPKVLKHPVVIAQENFKEFSLKDSDFLSRLSKSVGIFQAEGTFAPEKLAKWIASNISP